MIVQIETLLQMTWRVDNWLLSAATVQRLAASASVYVHKRSVVHFL